MNKKNILLIDDQPVMGIILKNKLENDFNVSIKHNGKEALAWIMEGNIPNVVVLDLNMPEMNGIEFIKEIRKFNYLDKIPLVVLSGEEGVNSRIEAFREGADDFLIKPFNPTELTIRINRFFDRYNFDKL
jgi:DNA-binding response OmpR family regulator